MVIDILENCFIHVHKILAILSFGLLVRNVTKGFVPGLDYTLKWDRTEHWKKLVWRYFVETTKFALDPLL